MLKKSLVTKFKINDSIILCLKKSFKPVCVSSDSSLFPSCRHSLKDIDAVEGIYAGNHFCGVKFSDFVKIKPLNNDLIYNLLGEQPVLIKNLLDFQYIVVPKNQISTAYKNNKKV